MPQIYTFDTQVQDAICKLAQYAEENPYTMNDLLDVMNGNKKLAGDIVEHTLILPFGYRIVYSIEQQHVADVRHVSISLQEQGALPDPAVVQTIMALLGFKSLIMDCMVELEDITEEHQAINIWEIIVE